MNEMERPVGGRYCLLRTARRPLTASLTLIELTETLNIFVVMLRPPLLLHLIHLSLRSSFTLWPISVCTASSSAFLVSLRSTAL